MNRVARAILPILTLSLLVTGCDWYGQEEIALRALPYPYDAGVAFDNVGEPSCLVDRGVTFVYDGEAVRTAGQDAACSLVDRGRQLWESLAFLYSRREWRAGSFFANRLFEPRTPDEGPTEYTYKTYSGLISNLPHQMPSDVVAQVVEAVTYELKAKGGVMVAGMSSTDVDGPSAAVAAYLRTEHQRGRVYHVERDRLLAYAFVRRYLDWEATRADDGVTIRMRAVDNGVAERWVPTLEELDGVTFYTPDPGRTRVFLAGELLQDVMVNPPDWTRRGSVTINAPAVRPALTDTTPTDT